MTDLAPSRAGAHLSRNHPRISAAGPRLYLGATSTPTPPLPPDKIDPVLAGWMRTGDQTRTEELLVTFRDTVRVPSFQSIAPGIVGAHTATTSAMLIQAIIARRAPDYAKIEDSLNVHTWGVPDPAERAWLIREEPVVIPLDRVLSLAAWDQVEYIEPRYSGEHPPQTDPTCAQVTPQPGENPLPCDDPIEARRQIGTDPYLDANLDGVRIGLLDTGVRSDHVMFQNPDRLSVIGSLANADHHFDQGPTAGRDVDPYGHGTSTAALLTGTGGTDATRFHGYTRSITDAIRIYRPAGDNPTVDRQAGVDGIEQAMAQFDAVILVETQPIAGPSSALSVEADAAVANGFVVVAPTGNLMPPLSDFTGVPIPNLVGAPATGRGVLSVGAFNVIGGAVYSDSRYEARDSHQPKPDLISPSQIETASNQDAAGVLNSSRVTEFPGTSGAAPGVAAAVALLWQSLGIAGVAIAPGYVMAGLIAGATLTAADLVTGAPAHGAGRVRLPQGGAAAFGYVDLSDGPSSKARDVVLDPFAAGLSPGNASYAPPGGTTAPPSHLDVAIWWPEGIAADPNGSARAGHSVVTIALKPSTGDGVASADGFSVWQRAGAPIDPSVPGNWTLHISGEKLAPATQRVYWFAWAHP